MDFDQIKDLIEFCAAKRVYEVEVEDKGVKLRIQTLPPRQKVRYLPLTGSATPAGRAAGEAESAALEAAFGGDEFEAQLAGEAPQPAAKPEKTTVEDKLVAIKSPMVGTLYHAPAPDAEPYVRIGDVVGAETVLCIIEAMKLMNEIKAEVRGKIAAILVENGQPVEFGQPLFLVEPL